MVQPSAQIIVLGDILTRVISAKNAHLTAQHVSSMTIVHYA